MHRQPDIRETDRRRADRLLPMFSDIVWRIADTPDTALLIDASRHGFRFRTPHALRVGTTFVLQPDEALLLTANIRWQREQDYGCAFTVGVSPADFSRILSCDCVVILPRERPGHLQSVK